MHCPFMHLFPFLTMFVVKCPKDQHPKCLLFLCGFLKAEASEIAKLEDQERIKKFSSHNLEAPSARPG